VVDANAEFCAVMKLKLARLNILMAAEMDCEEHAMDGTRQYVELKVIYIYMSICI